MELQGKTVLVTGGVRRLGLAMAHAVAARGANVALHFRSDPDEAARAVAALRSHGGRVEAFRADLRDAPDIDRMVADVKKVIGSVDVLVNNAAVFERKEFLALTVEEWDRTLDTNLRAPFLCARAVAPGMIERGAGKIVNLACVGGIRPWPAYVPYSVSKAGLIMLTETLARALAPGVQVNAIAPGWIEFDDSPSSAAYPFPKGVPDDITRALIYLLESDYVTGETLLVDGGRHLGG